MISRKRSLLSTAATLAAFFVSSAQAAVAPTKAQGGLDPTTMVGTTPLSAVVAGAAKGAVALPAASLGVVGGAAPLGSCAVRPTRTYAGAIIGATDLAVAANVPNLQATHNASFYLTSYALTQVSGLSVAAIQSNWTSQATGILEVGTDPVNMPDIAANYSGYVTTANNWTWGTTKGTTWPALIAAGGWKPSVAMLNTFQMGTTNSITDPYYLMNVAAIADVKAAAPSIKYVLPYLTPNFSQVNATNVNTDFTFSYWGENRALASLAGGLGLDTPSNYFLHVRDAPYRALVAQEITWAKANGLVSEVLLSPYSLNPVTGTQPQFQYDASFLEAAKAEISYLHGMGADPTFYVVANYSEGAGTNAPGSDTGTETVDATALWVARNAPTSPMPTSFPAGFQTEAAAPCAPALQVGRNSTHVLSSDVDGLGGMAWQDPGNIIGSGSLTGLSALSTLSSTPVTLGSDGSAPIQLKTDGAGNVELSDTNSAVSPNLNLAGNLHIEGLQNLLFGSTLAYPVTMSTDGVGNFTIGSSLLNGNIITSNNLHITGGQSVALNSAGAYPFYMSSDGTGNTAIGSTLANGNINTGNNIHVTGPQNIILNSAGNYPFSMSNDGLGNASFGSSLLNGNLLLTNNLHITGGQNIALNSAGSYPFLMSSDGAGNTTFGSGLASGKLRISDSLLMSGSITASAGFSAPLVATTPTNTSPTYTGSVPMVVTADTHVPCFYVAGSWVCGGTGTATASIVYGTTAGTAAQGNDARIVGAAPTASPALTGTPTAPTAAAGSNSTQIATTAYDDRGVAGEATIARAAEAALAPKASPMFTGTPTAPTQASTDTSTALATDGFVANALAGIQASGGGVTSAQSTRISNSLQNGNNLSDVLNVPAARSNLGAAASGSNPDITALTGLTTFLPITEGGTGASTASAALLGLGGAPLASPALTGNPTAPTQTAGDSSNKIASTGFVGAAISASPGATALQTANLPSSPFTASLETSARSLAGRFSDLINVKGQGAVGDGSTVDTAAFQRAIAVLTGNITGNSLFTAAQQTQLAALNGVGPAISGKGCIDVPPGVYVVDAALVANLQTNNAFCVEGAGSGLSKLRFTSAGDGLDINFAATSLGNDIVGSPSTSYPGQSVVVKGLGFQTAYNGASNTGVALNIKGIPLINSNVAPNQIIEDVSFTNADGWSGSTQAWGTGLRFTDPDFLFIKNVRSVDLRQGKTAGFQMISDTPSGGTGHGEILCEDCGSYGGSSFFDISGRGIQGVYFERPYWLDNVKTGITWLAANNTSSGSISIHAASGTALQANVHVSNIGTYFSTGSFYYSAAYTAATNWYGEFLDNVDWVNVSGDTITAPPAGVQASGPATTAAGAYGIVINQGNMGTNVYDALPSVISNVSVAGSDVGFSAQGPNVLVQGGICGPNSSTNSSGVTTATQCYANTYTGTDKRFNPHFENMVTGDNTIVADAGHDTVIHGSPIEDFASALEIGMPGITIPGVGQGYSGAIDWHSSTPSDWTSGANGTLAKQIDYDCRESVSGGSGTVVGQGAMTFTCAGGVRSTANMYAINFITSATGALLANTIGAVDPTAVTYLSDPMGYLSAGPIADGSATDPTVTATGFSFTGINSGATINCGHTTDTYATGTVTLPVSPLNQQHFALRSTCTVSALTLAANTGQTLLAYTLPTQLTPAFPMEVVWDASTKAWTQVSGINPTAYATQVALNNEVTTARAAEALLAPKASPALTGTPTAPTASASANSTQIATTAYADAGVGVETSRATAIEATKAPLASPVLTGTPTAPTASASTNSTQLATTAYATTAVSGEASIARAMENMKAPLASPTLTGAPTAPTQASGDNTVDLATDAFVTRATAALLASPAFTGTPTAPTAACTVSNTQIATTAYVAACAPAAGTSGNTTSGAITASSITNSGTTSLTGAVTMGGAASVANDLSVSGNLNLLTNNAVYLKYSSSVAGNYIFGDNGGNVEISSDAGGAGGLVAGKAYFSGTLTAQTTILPVNVITASYTLLATDCGKVVQYAGTTAITVTVPTTLGSGCRVNVSQDGTGVVSVTNASGEILAGYSLATSAAVASTSSTTVSFSPLGQYAGLVILQKSNVATVSNGQ